jgi:hypothetical protein
MVSYDTKTTEGVLAHLERAHKMGVSSLDQPEDSTLYGLAAKTVRDLMNKLADISNIVESHAECSTDGTVECTAADEVREILAKPEGSVPGYSVIWDVVGGILQEPSNHISVPEYRKHVISRIKEQLS